VDHQNSVTINTVTNELLTVSKF